MKNRELIRMVFGSHLYGTNTPESDTDIKGVGLPTKEQVEADDIPKTTVSESTGFAHQKNTPDDTDTEIYSVHHFIKLALEGQTVALDMLHAPREFWMTNQASYVSIWESIVDQRQRFYTKNVESFIRYARKQAAKYGLKGSRLSDCKAVIAWLEMNKLCHGERIQIGKLDLNAFPKGDYIVWNAAPAVGTVHADQQIMPSVSVCEKTFGITTPIRFMLEPLQKYYNQYGDRAKQAEANCGVDWKAISHAFRAAYQIRELFTEGTITFPLKDREYLKTIKAGTQDYNFIGPELDDLVDEVSELRNKCSLPEQPDYEYWAAFLEDINNQILRGDL